MSKDEKRAKPLPPQSPRHDEDAAGMPEPPQRLVDLAKELEERLQRRKRGPKAEGAHRIRGAWLH